MNDPLVLGIWMGANAAGLVIAVFIVHRVLRQRSRRKAQASNLQRGADGAMTAPVIAAFTGLKGWPALIALASNSRNPRLILRPGSLEYRVTALRRVAFEDIESVRLVTAPRTTNLLFTFRTGPFTLSANVGEEDVALRLIESYPELAAKRIFPLRH